MMDKSLFKLPGVHPLLGIVLVFSLIQAALIVGQAHFLATLLADLFAGGTVTAFHTASLGAFLGCFAATQLVSTVQEHLVDKFSVKVANGLQESLLGVAFSDASTASDKLGSASLTVSALEGIDQVEEYLRVVLPKIIGVVAIPIPLLIVVFLDDFVSGIILLVMFPVIIMFMILIGKNTAARAAKQYESYHALSNRFMDTLRGIATLEALGAGKRSADDVYESSENFREATMKTIAHATLSSGVLDLIATLGVAAVAMMLGFRLLDSTMTLYPALLALFLAPEYFKPIRAFASNFHASQDGKNALASINAVLDAAAQVPAIGETEIARWTQDSVLEAQGISYSYDEAPSAALSDSSFTLEGLSRVAIVGQSGSGKSTLARLLAGFAIPSAGTFTLNGTKLESLYERDWRQQLIYIPQNPYIFHATLKSNVAFYTPEASDEEIESAIDAVGLRALVDSLPEGMNTIIGQGGRSLSGGQAQRIAFARALLDRSRNILVLDEPTAHLDIETELELKSRMLNLFADRLVVLATHRLHWLDSVDQVIVVEDGRVADCGTPAELLAHSEALERLMASAKGGDAA